MFDYTSIIKNRYNNMGTTDKKIADYILNDPKRILRFTVSDLANEMKVAGSSIIRFCQKLGFKGYTEFKLLLAESMPFNTNKINNMSVSRNDTERVICNKVFGSHLKTLSDTLALMDYDALKNSIKAIKRADHIEIYGVGTSSTLAWDFYYRLMRIGISVYCVTDPHISRVSASKLTESSVAFGISHTGRTIDTIETLKIAKQKKATIICLTSNGNSPICDIADIMLTVYSDEVKETVEAVSARIAHVAVLDTICTSLAISNYENAMENINAMSHILQEVRLK